MTTAARSVLANCELALTDFEAGAATDYWRSRFIALITGLRSVGLVLKLTDYPVASEAGKRAIDEAWTRLNASKPEPRIFHEFIDVERYNAAHLYAVNAAVNITVRLGSLWVNVSTGESGSEPSGPATYETISCATVRSRTRTQFNSVVMRWRFGGTTLTPLKRRPEERDKQACLAAVACRRAAIE